MSDIEQGPVDFRRVDIPAFIKRLVRYYEVNGNGDWRYAAETIEQQHGEIERLRARVAELEAAQEWRPIESAPRETWIIGWHEDLRGFVIKVPNNPQPDDVVPTHWLPLPAPPKVAT